MPQLDQIKPQDLLPMISQEAQVEESHWDAKDKLKNESSTGKEDPVSFFSKEKPRELRLK